MKSQIEDFFKSKQQIDYSLFSFMKFPQKSVTQFSVTQSPQITQI